MSTGKSDTAATEPAAGGDAANQRLTLRVDESRATTGYANFCSVQTLPEELIADMGLRAQQLGGPQTVTILHRVVMSYNTAKALAKLLDQSIKQHEDAVAKLQAEAKKRPPPPKS